MAESDTSTLEILIAVQTLAAGGLLAFPVAAPELAVYEPEEDWQEEMRRGLEKLLPAYPPEALAALLFRRGELLEVEVELDLRPRDFDRGGHLLGSFPCLVTATGNDRWVTALRLGHSFHATAAENLSALAAAEIRRALKARMAAGEDPLRLLPPASTRLELLPIRLGPPRSWTTKKERRSEDLALLEQIGAPFTPARGLLPRPAEEARLAPLLQGARRLAVLVVGADGVGKSALIERCLAGRQLVYRTSGYQWLAGQSLAGQLEERVQQVMAAAARLDAILYFERFDELLKARGSGDDLLSLLRPFVTSEKVRLLGELGSDRLDEAQRSHSSFFAATTVVRVEAMNDAESRAVLRDRLAGLLPEAEQEGLRESLAEALLELSHRYFPDHPLPGIALSLFDDLAALETEARAAGRQVELADLYRLAGARTGIPELLLRDDLALRAEPLRAAFRARVVGQEEAIEQLVSILSSIKARLQPEGKPLAVLLFAGPTGVGKTEAARCLAQVLFGDEKRLVRFDMSEFSDRWAAERLIRGNDREEGLLTRRIRREPFAVVLLDEIEKAHRAVFDLLLQVAGEGRLTDARGRTASFHNVILIMTSNLGAEQRGGRLGFAGKGPSTPAFYRAQVEDFFRPEFVNRLDRVIAFLPLSPAELAQITRLQLAGVAGRRGFEERGLRLEIDEAVTLSLAEAAQAPGYGARRLRRELRQKIVAPAAELIARHAARARDGRVRVTRAGDAPAAGSAIGRVAAGGFSFALEGRRAASEPAAPRRDRPEGELQDLRRVLRRLLRGETLDHLAQDSALTRNRLFEIQLRLQKLADQSRRRGQPPPRQQAELLAEAARLEQRRHRFEAALEPLRELRQEVEDAEELALAELFAGEDPGGWRQGLEGWRDRLRRHLSPALLAAEEGPAVCLLLTEADDQHGFAFWLSPLLRFAADAGIAVGGWPLAEKSRLEPGSRLDLAGLEKWLATPKRARQLILEVGDPALAARLDLEAGWHRFAPEKDSRPAYLSVARVLRAKSGDQEREALRRQHLQRQPPAEETLRRLRPLRSWRLENDWLWPEGPPPAAGPHAELLHHAGLERFALPAGDYWRRQGELLSVELAPRELDGDLDAGRETLALRLPGAGE